MFLIGQVTYFKETDADTLIKRPTFSCRKHLTFSCYTNFPKF